MPACARKDIVRKGEIATYHVWSRCVQGAWLCGRDPQHGTDYSHRREWIEQLLEYLAGVFAVDVGGYHVLSNHQHAVLCTRPDLAATWDDEEVAYRWKMAWPQWTGKRWECEPADSRIQTLLDQGDEHIAELRGRLSSLSWFVGRWKQPLARASNRESNRRGHFFEARYGSRELVDHDEIFRALAYNELQQVKAGCADSAESSLRGSFERRFRSWRAQEALESVTKFRQGENTDEYQLQPEQIEDLLAASWLAPISTDSPLLRMCGPDEAEGLAKNTPPGQRLIILHSAPQDEEEEESTSATGQPGDAEESNDSAAIDASVVKEPPPPDDQSDNNSQSGNNSDISEGQSNPGGEQPSGNRQRSRRSQQHTIHRRLRRRLKRRPDRPILEVPWESYYEGIKQLETAWKRARLPTLTHSQEAEDPPGAAAATATSCSWGRDIRLFQVWIQAALQRLPAKLASALHARGDPA